MERSVIKRIILSLNVVPKNLFPNERVVRDIISELAFQDIIYVPLKKNGDYKRVYGLEELSQDEKKRTERYQRAMLKGAIKTIRRAKKLKKWLIGEENKRLMGELEMELANEEDCSSTTPNN